MRTPLGTREDSEPARHEHVFFFFARQALDRELQAQRVALVLAATNGAQRKWPATACVTSAAAGVVRRNARRNIERDARVQRAVRTTRDVQKPALCALGLEDFSFAWHCGSGTAVPVKPTVGQGC
jgi:hypothetical protein